MFGTFVVHGVLCITGLSTAEWAAPLFAMQ